MRSTAIIAILAVLVCACATVAWTQTVCPNVPGAMCDGCQCCPDGCRCPNAPPDCTACKDCATTVKPTTTTTMRKTTQKDTTMKGATTTTSRVPTGGTTNMYTSTSAAPGTLILDEEFNELNFQLWKHELTLSGGGNWEFEMYHNNRSTSYVRDGILYLKPGLMSDFLGSENAVKTLTTLDIWGGSPADLCTDNFEYGCMRTAGAGGNYLNPITSARLRTAEFFAFKYGKVEVKAKLPKGDWLWPAIWMLPRDNAYGNWPASGEIDICESRGNAQYPLENGGGVESFGSTLHFGPAWNADHWEKAHEVYTLPGGTFNDDFHIFGLKWTADAIITYLDTEDNVVLNTPIDTDFWTMGEFDQTPPYSNPWVNSPNKNAPFDKEYYLILNLAVGGTGGYFPDGVGGKPWSNTDDHAVNAFLNAKGQWYSTWDQQGEGSALQVDSIKIWAL